MKPCNARFCKVCDKPFWPPKKQRRMCDECRSFVDPTNLILLERDARIKREADEARQRMQRIPAQSSD